MLFGNNPCYKVILHCLGLTKEDTGRFRDCYVEDKKIIIYTRNGGGNREYFQEVFYKLSKHPNYIQDYDDSGDCTYAYIEFSLPEKWKDDLLELSKIKSGGKVSEKFQKLIEEMNKPVGKMTRGNNEKSKSKL